MARFEVVSKYADAGINLPKRSTTGSAGYDFEVAEDTIIPSFYKHFSMMRDRYELPSLFDLETMSMITKELGAKPTLVPTGIKCKLDPGTFLNLSVRSSCPLKYWLVLANAQGIIDSDYWNSEGNEGHILFQLINLSPYDLLLNKGDIIGQGIITPYLITEDDAASGDRKGGFGSTNG